MPCPTANDPAREAARGERAALHDRRQPGLHPAARRSRLQLPRPRRRARSATRRPARGSARWRSRRPGPTSGSAPGRTATCRPPVATRAAASSTATTPRWRAGPRHRTTSTGWSPSPRPCRRIRRRVRRGPRAAAALSAREGPGGGRPAARADAHPGRQRRVRAAQPVVRADDDARSPRQGRGHRHPVPVPRQVRRRCTRSDLRDRRLASIVRRCQELPGQELFAYVDDDGEVRDVASDDVNDYLREASGGDFTAKDFRTWAGTVLAYRALRALQPEDDGPAARRNVVEAMRRPLPARQHAGGRSRELRPSGRPGGVPRRRLARRPGRGGRGAGRAAARRGSSRGAGRGAAAPSAARQAERSTRRVAGRPRRNAERDGAPAGGRGSRTARRGHRIRRGPRHAPG